MMSTPPMKAQNLGRDVIRVNHTPTLSTRLESIFTQTLSFNAGSSEHAKTYHLHLCLCRMRHARVTSHMPRDLELEALEDPALILLPTLGEATSPQNPRQSKASGFFVRVESVGRTVEVLMGPQPRFQPLPIKLARFVDHFLPDHVFSVAFKASEWLRAQGEAKEMLIQALDVFAISIANEPIQIAQAPPVGSQLARTLRKK